MLWKVARSFAFGPEQDDLHQELLLALWKAVPAFRGECQATTFVYRVIYNYALTWNRRRRVVEVGLPDALQAPDACSRDEEAKLQLMYSHIRSLPMVDRTLLLLYLDEVSYREIGEVLGITESNVGVRLNRAKKLLAERIDEVSRA